MFTNSAEGHLGPITPQNINNGLDTYFRDGFLTMPGIKKGSITYFISDQRSNVRMILTEET